MDTTFDFRSEIPPGRDADVWSETLQRYHKVLWSKSLPGGEPFQLTTGGNRGRYHLVYEASGGRLELSSDAITSRLASSAVAKSLTEMERPYEPKYTIGRALLFPRVQRQRMQTINQRRGTHPAIRDRFDLTLECIRRHYADEASPLGDLFQRYADFFVLFTDFRGYVDFFLLQDMVDSDYSIRFFHPFSTFSASPFPATTQEYLAYIAASNDFHTARNARIAAWVAAESGESMGWLTSVREGTQTPRSDCERIDPAASTRST